MFKKEQRKQTVGQLLVLYLIALGWSFVSELEYSIYGILGIREAALGLHLSTLISLYVQIGAIIIMLIVYRKRPWLTALPFAGKKTVRLYGGGALLGLGMFTVVWAVIWLAGDFRVTNAFRSAHLGLVLLYVGGFMIQSLLEELLCRGYLMGYWLKQNRVVVAVLANTAFFMFMHIANPGFDLRAAVGLFFFGLFMSLLRLATGSIWFGAAVHGAWNFAEGIIYGTAVSGLPNVGLILHSTPLGKSSWLDGGTFGIERSLPSIVLHVAVIGVVVWLWQNKRSGRQLRDNTAQ